MKLLTSAQRQKLIDNGRRQVSVKGTPDEIDFEPVVKLFNPCGAATWLLTEIDPSDETVAWGLCDLGMGFPEFGTVNLTELAAYRGRLGLGIERDLHFKARGPISRYIEAASKAGHIVENIDRGDAKDEA
ncbi:DUF2958 domain-containing protein [Bradyrhizobium sp. CCGUVB23]|uniref:DUF2958 domain-containing protein n=1 Tax=Bradyrhizobium sp. CCGUVB23 TaxID=2949630 RepID=UPI0020B357D9|nr:DUF2958 domain-containing protein [Bradyrhizobium sp. CCGUVB23]MCP3468315.1 DUF2958 domain-containing protein [Bradyrhizobium sp. CCGUVB23]